MNVIPKLISTPGQLILISLLLAGFSNAADREKNIVPHPNDPIPKTEVKKFTRAQAAADSRKPNILLILVDDMGYGDPQCFNPKSRLKTPG
ncbi:MAG: hypothetical protein HOI15_08865, partial [Opitutales bacterium]|nr:hypothetical protein [Opitutales bacterium]